MFYGILGALLVSMGDIAYKKSVVISGSKLSNYGYQFISGIVYLLIIVLIYFLVIFFNLQEVSQFWSLKNFFILFLIGIIGITGGLLSSYAYKNEKISILTPYQQFETIFTVIFGFLFFSGVSLKSFIFVLIAGVILIIGSIDFKKFTFNKSAFAVMISSLIYSIKANLIAYLLISITPLESILFPSIFTFFFAFILIFFKKEISQSISGTNKKMILFMNTESITRILVGLVYAYLITEIGIIQTSLLGLLNIFTNMIFGYLIFREKPTKKDYIIAFLVALCVIGGNIS